MDVAGTDEENEQLGDGLLAITQMQKKAQLKRGPRRCALLHDDIAKHVAQIWLAMYKVQTQLARYEVKIQLAKYDPNFSTDGKIEQLGKNSVAIIQGKLRRRYQSVCPPLLIIESSPTIRNAFEAVGYLCENTRWRRMRVFSFLNTSGLRHRFRQGRREVGEARPSADARHQNSRHASRICSISNLR